MPFDPSTAKPVSMFDPTSAKALKQPDTSSPPLSWSDVGSQAWSNLVPSAKQTAEAMITPILHPIDTGKALYHTAAGEAEKLIPGKQGDEKYADALNGYIANRYGGTENIKRSIASDPVGVATDLALLLSGGGGALAKAGGTAGKIGEVAADVGKAVNPVNAALKTGSTVAKAGGKALASTIGTLTGTGAEPLKVAAAAGLKGGEAATQFLNNMRGNAPLEEVVNSAKRAVSRLRQERGAAYREGMAGVSKDKTVLDMQPILDEVKKTDSVKNFQGVDLSPSTAKARQQIAEILNEWATNPNDAFRTPEGLDALKQRIADVRDSLPYNTPERLVADNAYNAVRGAIVKQAPEYAKVMKDYETASNLITEIEKSLSLGKTASADTALRKLQSIMRNNVNTNYGRRGDLAKVLTEHGAPHLMEQLAGQNLNKLAPRGLATVPATLEVALALSHLNPLPLGMLALSSPRLMGEGAYYLGAGARGAATVARGIATPAAALRAPDAALLSYGADLPLAIQEQRRRNLLPPPGRQPLPIGFGSPQ